MSSEEDNLNTERARPILSPDGLLIICFLIQEAL